jgi:hypothetical protein
MGYLEIPWKPVFLKKITGSGKLLIGVFIFRNRKKINNVASNNFFYPDDCGNISYITLK